MSKTKIVLLMGALAVANEAMATLNPFSPQLALSTIPTKTSLTTVSTTSLKLSPLAMPSTTVIIRSGFTLPPPTGAPTPITLLPPPPPPPAK